MGYLDNLHKKIYPDRTLLKKVLDRLGPEKRIIFSNGCFDLLHVGHINYLNQARDLGDILVIAVNSDDSVRRLKGAGRPIHNAKERCLLLAALQCTDFVTVFSEDTPAETLSLLKPQIHTKGGDYKITDLPERKVIDSYGGEIVILPLIPGYSTSIILQQKKATS